jgi:hypothetical protein
MEYSVRTRRRLRPPTNELARAASTSSGQVEVVIADGSGATRQPLVTRVIEIVSPRARASGAKR